MSSMRGEDVGRRAKWRAIDAFLAALRLSEGGSISRTKNTKSDAPNGYLTGLCIIIIIPSSLYVSSRRLEKAPLRLHLFPRRTSSRPPSLARSLSLNCRSPFTTSTTLVVAHSPHSIYHFSSRSLHAVLPVDPWISPEPSFPMDRYKPTTNHPRERSLFFLTPLWTPFQIPLCLPWLLSPGSTRDIFGVFRYNSPCNPSRSYPLYLPRFFFFFFFLLLLLFLGLSPRRTRVRLLVPAIATHSSRNYVCKRGTHFDLYTLASVHELSLLTKRVVGAGRV